MRDIHIGTLIRQKIKEASMSIKEFSDRIHCDRTTVYDIFKRKIIDTERLIRISEALDYDFINEVYLKQEPHKFTSTSPFFLVIEIQKEELQQLDLPDNIIRLIE